MQKRPIAAALSVVVLSTICAACDKSPTRPAPKPTPTGPVLSRVEMSGPDTIAPGATGKYTLTGFLSDGTTRDVTAEAAWRSTNAPAATIDQAGLATGLVAGETLISGAVGFHSSAKNLIVTPPGTFRLRGTVVDSGSGLRIGSAEVEVGTATGVQLQTTTRPEGTFELYAVPADAELRVTYDGYLAYTKRLQLSGHSTLQVSLKLVAPVDLAGTYRLTVGALTCPGLPSLAEELRERTYVAVVTLDGSRIDGRLSGAQFATGSGFSLNVLSGFLQGTRAKISLFGPESGWYGYYSGFTDLPSVAERLSDGTFLVTSGNADLSVSGSRWEGTLNGNMRHLETVPNGRLLGQCSGSIPMTLTK